MNLMQMALKNVGERKKENARNCLELCIYIHTIFTSPRRKDLIKLNELTKLCSNVKLVFKLVLFDCVSKFCTYAMARLHDRSLI